MPQFSGRLFLTTTTMAPHFISFKDLRRRSRASFRTERSTDTSSDGVVSQGTTPSTGSVTPPSIAHQSDPALNLQTKKSSNSIRSARPSPAPSSNYNRYSTSGLSGLGSPPSTSRHSIPLSQYAPRVTNVCENAWVGQLSIGPVASNSTQQKKTCAACETVDACVLTIF